MTTTVDWDTVIDEYLARKAAELTSAAERCGCPQCLKALQAYFEWLVEPPSSAEMTELPLYWQGEQPAW